ncbi:TraB/GumN family protein [Frateuria aurantia]
MMGGRRRTWSSWVLALMLLCLGRIQSLSAQTVAPAASRQDAATLVPVVVTGVQPGPGLWRVSRNGHVLWILGTTSPLPQHMQWQSDQVAEALARSQALLDPPGVKMKLDTGFFGKLWLLPSLIGVRNNPDDKKLRDVVDPADYAHWLALKQRYIGDSDKVERWRPIFAAHELYHQALARQGLVGAGSVLFQVHQLAGQDHLPRVSTTTTILLLHPHRLVTSFKQSDLDDRRCFSETLDHLDTDLQQLTERARDWAVGDIDGLRAAYAHDVRATCLDAIGEAGFFKQQGLADIPERQQQHWLEVTEAAVAQHATVFALVPMELLLGPGPSYLAALQAAGYRVEIADPSAGSEPAAASSGVAPATAGSADRP